MTGSWWPFSSEEMTCVSTATTEWVAARRRRGEFAIIRQIKDVFHKRQPPHNGTVARKYSIPSCCATPGVQSRLMISLLKWDRSLELNNKALWPALPPLIVILCRSWMRHARPSMSTFCPPLPFSSYLLSQPRLALNQHMGHSAGPCSWRGINNRGQARLSSSCLLLLSGFASISWFSSPPPPSLFLSIFSITLLVLRWVQSSLSLNACALKRNIRVQHQFKMSPETAVVTA